MANQARAHKHRLPSADRGRAQDRSRDDLIISAALEILADKGYHDLTMTDVATHAGVSKATLYRRWTAKADLVADAVATLRPMVAPHYSGTSLRDDLVALIAQAGNCDDSPDVVTATMEMARAHPVLYRTLNDKFSSFLKTELAGFARRSADEGNPALTGIELELLSDTVVALLAHHARPAGESMSRKRLSDVVDHVLMVLLTGRRIVK